MLPVAPSLPTVAIVNNPPEAQTDAEPLDAESLEQRHPQWRVWQSDESGHWWAARHKNLGPRQMEAGCIPYAKARSAPDLDALLTQQDALNTQDAS